MGSRWMGVAALLGVAVQPHFARGAPRDFAADFALDLRGYAGSWHELARTTGDFEDNTPIVGDARYGVCSRATVHYELASPTRIRVLKRCTRARLDGPGEGLEDELEGVGLVVPESDGRKLKLAFGNALFRMLTRVLTLGGADVWVYAVGPLGDDGRYAWALVGSPARDQLAVLSRAPDLPSDTLAEILRHAEAEELPVDELVFDSQR